MILRKDDYIIIKLFFLTKLIKKNKIDFTYKYFSSFCSIVEDFEIHFNAYYSLLAETKKTLPNAPDPFNIYISKKDKLPNFLININSLNSILHSAFSYPFF